RDPLYFRRAPDAEAEAAAGRTGETLVIRAPSQMGKSSLAVRYLAACKANGKIDAYVDFQLLDEHDLATRQSLIRAVASRILHELDLGTTGVTLCCIGTLRALWRSGSSGRFPTRWRSFSTRWTAFLEGLISATSSRCCEAGTIVGPSAPILGRSSIWSW